jgi:hypothetical protein
VTRSITEIFLIGEKLLTITRKSPGVSRIIYIRLPINRESRMIRIRVVGVLEHFYRKNVYRIVTENMGSL